MVLFLTALLNTLDTTRYVASTSFAITYVLHVTHHEFGVGDAGLQAIVLQLLRTQIVVRVETLQ